MSTVTLDNRTILVTGAAGFIGSNLVKRIYQEIKNFEQIYIVACGSAWHVGMAVQYVLEDMMRLRPASIM